MRQPTEEFSARRFSSSFDTVLPPDVREEIAIPKRPVMLRQPPDRFGILKLAGASAHVAIILAAVIGNYTQSHAAQHTAAPIVQPTPIPAQPFGPL